MSAKAKQRVSVLIQQRQLIANRLTSLQTYARNFTIENDEVENLECRLEILDGVKDDFDTIQKELSELLNVTEDNTADVIANANNVFDNYFCSIKGTIKKKLAQYQLPSPQSYKSSQPVDVKPQTQVTKLPPIPIPSFDGDVKHWITFRDTFQALVIDQKINDVAKLHYLRESCKSGDAWKLICDVQLNDDSFGAAWASLKRRYDNSNAIIDSCVAELFKIRSVSSKSSAELWKLVENFTMNLKALESLGEPVAEWRTLIIHMIKFRLDDETRSLWEAQVIKSKERPTLQDLEIFLVDRCHVLEAVETGTRRK